MEKKEEFLPSGGPKIDLKEKSSEEREERITMQGIKQTGGHKDSRSTKQTGGHKGSGSTKQIGGYK